MFCKFNFCVFCSTIYVRLDHKPPTLKFVSSDDILRIFLYPSRCISGTSTGGLICASILLGMSLTQTVALYMDPQTCNRIFSFRWRVPGLQAKYTQDGLDEVLNCVLDTMVLQQGTGINVKFVDAVKNYNGRLKKKRASPGLDDEERKNLKQTLQSNTHLLNDNGKSVDSYLDDYHAALKNASGHLKIATMKRFKFINNVTNKEGLNEL